MSNFLETGILIDQASTTVVGFDAISGVDANATVMLDMEVSVGSIKLVGAVVRIIDGKVVVFKTPVDTYTGAGAFIVYLNKGVTYSFETSIDFVGSGWALLLAGGKFDKNDQ